MFDNLGRWGRGVNGGSNPDREWVCRQWAQAAQGMMEVPKQAARPPSEDEDEDEDSSERPRGDRKEPMPHKGGLILLLGSMTWTVEMVAGFR
jgi:hypothetical protein